MGSTHKAKLGRSVIPSFPLSIEALRATEACGWESKGKTTRRITENVIALEIGLSSISDSSNVKQ